MRENLRLRRLDNRTLSHVQFVKGAPLSFRDRLEALWRKRPGLSTVDAARITGASRSVARTVAQRLRAAGKKPLQVRGGQNRVENDP